MRKFPQQSQMLLPLLDSLSCGKNTVSELSDSLSERFELPDSTRSETKIVGNAGNINLWDRHVRWTLQQAKLKGLAENIARSQWEITERGDEFCSSAKSGFVLVVYESENGTALWAEASSGAALFEDEIVDLILTSPPYPVLRKKDYSNQHNHNEHVEWLFSEISNWKRVISQTGSLILNLGDVWISGSPTMSLYQEKLITRLCEEIGFHLAEKLYWHNPSKMPSPAQWVTVKRVRVTPAIENIWWLSKSPNPKANNRNVLRPYSENMKSLIRRGGQAKQDRPSGHTLSEKAFGHDNGGSIAHNILTFPNTSSNDPYQRYCRENNIKPHPARFPIELAEWLIKFLTDEQDVVFDPFGGSLTTAAACENLNRRWLSTEKELDFLRGSQGRKQLVGRWNIPSVESVSLF